MLKVGCCSRSERASVLILVLWVSIGLVAIALYFANTMTYELRASDNRASGGIADQAIDGAARYVSYCLQVFATNGVVPDNTQIRCEAVEVGNAKFWIIGRNAAGIDEGTPCFGLVDEGGKLNLNSANTNMLASLPNMTTDFADTIMDWRGTNGAVAPDYVPLGYLPKNAPFETVDELRLVAGAEAAFLAGEDLNRNGIADGSEKDLNSSGTLDRGLLEYTTVYTREPNFHADGTALTNVATATTNDLRTLFQNAGVGDSSVLARRVWLAIHPPGGQNPLRGQLDFAVRAANVGMSADDFAKIAGNTTTTTNTYIRSRVNINTAQADVLIALMMGLGVDESTAVTATDNLLNFREQNPTRLTSVAWMVEALGVGHPVIATLQRGDYVTTRSYQFTADIAAVGPHGRGYRRVKFVFDISNGTPIVLYRQDLSRLGWALGEKARQNLVAKDTQ